LCCVEAGALRRERAPVELQPPLEHDAFVAIAWFIHGSRLLRIGRPVVERRTV
jgi:hypothetical protein